MPVFLATRVTLLDGRTAFHLNSTAVGTSQRSFIDSFPSQEVKIVFTVTMIVMIIASLFGNFMVCHIVYQRPAMRSAINLLLANLALTDLLTALLCMPVTLVVLWQRNWLFGNTLCQIHGVLFYSLLTEKMLVLLVISLDRYFIIVKRRDNLNPSKAKLFAGLTWVCAVLISVMSVIKWEEYRYEIANVQCLTTLKRLNKTNRVFLWVHPLVSVIVPIGMMVVVYFLIFRTVRRNCFRVQNHPPVNPTAMHKRGRMFIDYSYKTRTFKTIFILSLLFVACILPFTITGLWLYHNRNSGKVVSSNVKAFVLWLVYLGSPLNPAVYAFRISKFREACLEVLPRSIWTLPSCVSLQSRRRIRPHVLYQVDKSSTFTVTSIV